jgi:CRISPR-associated protein Csd2
MNNFGTDGYATISENEIPEVSFNMELVNKSFPNAQDQGARERMEIVALVIANMTNPNGDTDTGRPRMDPLGYGRISPGKIKRNIRNQMQSNGCNIFYKSQDKIDDGCTTLKERLMKNERFMAAIADNDEKKAIDVMREDYKDVKFFGATIAVNFEKSKGAKNGKKKAKDQVEVTAVVEENEDGYIDPAKANGKGVSISIPGLVSVQWARSIEKICILPMGITKSCNGEDPKEGSNMSSDRMGNTDLVQHGVYVVKICIDEETAKEYGVTEADMEAFKFLIPGLFDDDFAANRPLGSLYVARTYFFRHKLADANHNDVLDSVIVRRKAGVKDPQTIEDYDITVKSIPGVKIGVVKH